MGYCMDVRDSKFFISVKNKEKALRAIKDLQHRVKEGGGCSYCGGKEDRSFSWVTTSEFVNAKTLKEAMVAWRWEVSEDTDENVNSIYFDGEKLGDDAILFEAIAPYVKKGSFIEMNGEDGCIWQWQFNGKTCIEKAATVSFI